MFMGVYILIMKLFRSLVQWYVIWGRRARRAGGGCERPATITFGWPCCWRGAAGVAAHGTAAVCTCWCPTSESHLSGAASRPQVRGRPPYLASVMGVALFAGAIAASAAVGSCNVIKNGINNSMAAVLGGAGGGSSVVATCQAVCGALLSCAALEVLGVGRSSATPPWAEVRQQLKPWMLLGGVLGMVSVTSQTFLIGPLGAVLLHVVQLSTELMVALLVDSFGCLNLRQRKLTPLRVVGVLLSIAGATMNVADFIGGSSSSYSSSPGRGQQEEEGVAAADGLMLGGYVLMAVAVGCCRPIQTVVNGGTKRVVQSSVRAALISLGVTLLCLLALSSALMLWDTRLASAWAAAWDPDTSQLKWWMATSGPMSTWSVIAPVLLAPIVSLSGFSGASMTGQLATSLMIDAGGFFGEARQATLWRVGGVCVVFGGAMLVQWSDRRVKLAAASRAQTRAGGGEEVADGELQGLVGGKKGSEADDDE
jgi:transporter family-2 protein